MSSRWKKGIASPYKNFIENLSPAERQAHLQARAEKKSMRLAMETVVLEQQEHWIANLNNAAAVLLAKAIEDGDHQAFIAVYDRLIGKPKEEIQVETDSEELLKAIIAHTKDLPD